MYQVTNAVRIVLLIWWLYIQLMKSEKCLSGGCNPVMNILNYGKSMNDHQQLSSRDIIYQQPIRPYVVL